MNATQIYFYAIGIIVIISMSAFVVSITSIEQSCNQCQSCENINTAAERLNMYDKNSSMQVNGVYFPNEDYYCVWTGGRNFENINRTDYHEACHAHVRHDYKHFCEDIKMVNKNE